MLRVKQLECLGMVYAQDLPSGWDIDGLLGRILAERVTTPSA